MAKAPFSAVLAKSVSGAVTLKEPLLMFVKLAVPAAVGARGKVRLH
jgi:hypothetical protein